MFLCYVMIKIRRHYELANYHWEAWSLVVENPWNMRWSVYIRNLFPGANPLAWQAEQHTSVNLNVPSNNYVHGLTDTDYIWNNPELSRCPWDGCKFLAAQYCITLIACNLWWIRTILYNWLSTKSLLGEGGTHSSCVHGMDANSWQHTTV